MRRRLPVRREFLLARPLDEKAVLTFALIPGDTTFARVQYRTDRQTTRWRGYVRYPNSKQHKEVLG